MKISTCGHEINSVFLSLTHTHIYAHAQVPTHTKTLFMWDFIYMLHTHVHPAKQHTHRVHTHTVHTYTHTYLTHGARQSTSHSLTCTYLPSLPPGFLPISHVSIPDTRPRTPPVPCSTSSPPSPPPLQTQSGNIITTS